eukprot:Rmarinus@m.6041
MKITPGLLVKATKTAPPTGITQEKFLHHLHHVNLSGRKIEAIENLQQCPNLRVLYLYDNNIHRIERLGTLAHLEHLYLQENDIEVIENLEKNTRLTKLYLNKNRIHSLTNLTKQPFLEELHLASQRIPQPLDFDQQTLLALSDSLLVLDVSRCMLTGLEPVSLLLRLQKLYAAKNKIVAHEAVEPVLRGCCDLMVLDLSGNPLASRPKYRDRILLAAQASLQTLDDTPVTVTEREFLRRLDLKKRVSSRGHPNTGLRRFSAPAAAFDQDYGRGAGDYGRGAGSTSIAPTSTAVHHMSDGFPREIVTPGEGLPKLPGSSGSRDNGGRVYHSALPSSQPIRFQGRPPSHPQHHAGTGPLGSGLPPTSGMSDGFHPTDPYRGQHGFAPHDLPQYGHSSHAPGKPGPTPGDNFHHAVTYSSDVAAAYQGSIAGPSLSGEGAVGLGSAGRGLGPAPGKFGRRHSVATANAKSAREARTAQHVQPRTFDGGFD